MEVLIPQGARSGYYLGSVTVKSGNTTLATMPVIIAVWQWPGVGYMPSTPTMTAMLGNWTYDGLCTQMYAPANSSFIRAATQVRGEAATAASRWNGSTLLCWRKIIATTWADWEIYSQEAVVFPLGIPMLGRYQ